jgi:fatty-acyl-CoA synthase/fatty acid CoA ligase FadD22
MNMIAELSGLVRRNRWHDRPAFHTGDRIWTHGELYDAAARAGTVLARAGVGPGRRVLIALPDEIGWVVSFLATVAVGGTAVPVNPALTADDHRFMAGDCDATVVVTTGELAGRFDGGRCLEVGRLLAEAGRADPASTVETDAPLYLHYTSGTTGRPKGVLHRQGNPAIFHRAIGRACFQMAPEDVTLSVSKLYFTYGFCNTLVFPLYSGSSAVLVAERPTPAVASMLVDRHSVSVLYAVPSWYGRAVVEADEGAFKSLRFAVTAGERISTDLTERSAALLGAPVLNQLGATEIGCAVTANTVGHNVPGTVGRPVPGFTLELRDHGGTPVGEDTEGILWVRGPTLMHGYLNRPDATAEALVDGALVTRDRLVRNADGTYTHLGRTDDMEMVGGITVSPIEVEDLLGTHPRVLEVAVAAVPDRSGATKLRAFVVPIGSDGVPEQLESELIALARARLAPFKVPRSVRFVTALPRTPSGKLRRFLLRKED